MLTNVKPRRSYRFGFLTLHHKGVHYVPESIKPSDDPKRAPYTVSGIFYKGKYYEDKFYITEEFKDFLTKNATL